MSDPDSLAEVRVEGKGDGKSSRKSDFVYVNSAFVGSVNTVSVNNVIENRSRTSEAPAPPITGVYREQYWACSRWPHTQRILAITVAILLGALVGLTLSIVFVIRDDDKIIGPIFRRGPVPD